MCGTFLLTCLIASAPDATRIPTPPEVHPRLYIRAEHIPDLRSRLEAPALAPVVERLRSLARRNRQFRVEWDAIRYVVDPDRDRGRAIVGEALDLLRACELPDRNDACRVTGRMMVTGAIVYDWLHPLLTAEERKAFIAEFVRLAKTQECGYPPVRQGSVTGHSSEAMILRDILSAGIAIHDEFPEMYDLAAGRIFREHIPARNWFYPGHAHHQGDSYGPSRYTWETFPLWIFDRLGAGNVYSPEQREVPYLWIYASRPDGQRLRAGDTYADGAAPGRPWGLGPGVLLTASYYGDGILLGQYLERGGAGNNEAIFEFLWRDPALAPKPIADLPLARYFGPPFGWMIARTGWGEDAAIVEMKVNEYNFTNHQHLDAGAFQIYYRGALAIDSGMYSGSSGQYGSPHCTNYYWRTIAHNALLIHDPQEVFHPRRPQYGNDGGQRLPNGRSEPRTLDILLDPANGYRTGEVLAHGFGPDRRSPAYALLQGDLTRAYSAKVREVRRSFAYLRLEDPRAAAALVVFDRVIARDPSFRKIWLLHSIEEPRIEGTTAVIERTERGGRGRLVLSSLLPGASKLAIEAIGGPGKEFWAFGTNYANDADDARRARSTIEPGAWRIEVSPREPAAEDLFLQVMLVADRDAGATLPVRRIDAGERIGCAIDRSGGDGGSAVLFRRDARRGSAPFGFDVAGKGGYRILVADLAAGEWTAWRADDPAPARVLSVSPEEGAAWFEGQAGAWRFARGRPQD
ncbi:MAG: heparinase II/III family protein [Planctomycetes bacterium]|nr:heparinase II/III family protein [Planctomycetota bacterium]